MSTGDSFAGWSDADESADDWPQLGFIDPERYERIDLVGAGGMGRVYEAFDRRLQRRVALKEVRPELSESQGAQRLAQEALLAADLEHPGIVSVHDAGRTEDGRLFYTMRLVRGRSLAELLDGLAPDSGVAARVRLLRHVLDACNAVAFAHSRGVIHRDLKPANILVGEFGETQVVDWGLARKLDDERPHGRVGTVGYMSPEAEAGQPCDPRSDVWSLGATLRACMGAAPPPDLAAVAERASADDPAARYPTGRELAEDLARFLDGRRVQAYDYSTTELLRRLVRAWRAPLTVAALAALVLAGVAAASYLRVTQARDRAVVAEGEAVAALAQSDASLARSLQSQAAAALADGRFPAAEVLAANALVLQESPEARGVLLGGAAGRRPELLSVEPLPDCSGVRLGQRDVFCFVGRELQVWRDGALLWSEGPITDAVPVGEHVVLVRSLWELELRAADGGLVARDSGLLHGLRNVRVSADGRSFHLANAHGVTHWTVPDLHRVDRDVCSEQQPVNGSAVHGDTSWVVCRGGDVVEVPREGPRRVVANLRRGEDDPSTLVWADGVLLAGTTHGYVHRLELDGRSTGFQARDGAVDHVVPLRGDRVVAVAGNRSGVRIWDARSAVELLRLPAPSRAVAATPGGVAVAGHDLRRWRLPEQPRATSWQARSGVSAVSTSGDGRWLAAAGGDGAVTVWDLRDGSLATELRWQDRVAKAVAFRGDRLYATALGEYGARAWRVGSWQLSERWSSGPLRRMGVLADGSVWGLGYGFGAHLDLRSADRRAVHSARLFDGSTAPDGSHAVVLAEDGGVLRLDEGGLTPLGTQPEARAVAAGGAIALERGGGGSALPPGVAIALESAVLVGDRRFEAPGGGLLDVALSPDGRWLAAGQLQGRALLWSVSRGELVAVLAGHRDRVAAVHFDDDDTLFTADWSGLVVRWELGPAEQAAAELVAEVQQAWNLDLQGALSPEQ